MREGPVLIAPFTGDTVQGFFFFVFSRKNAECVLKKSAECDIINFV